MRREQLISRLQPFHQKWDICIIGGGATGLGIALDAASRGLKTILLERYDFAKGTSSRSTKLIHGGVRYLQQGNVKLVMEALRERGILKKNAPHLVRNQSFIVPNYKWWEGPYYGIGLKIYDWMSGDLGLGRSQLLSREEVLELAPTLDASGLRGGVLYQDGQFDDARLALNIAQTATEHGALILNYFHVTGFLKAGQKITGVRVTDTVSRLDYELQARTVVNATGVFSDEIQQADEPQKPRTIMPSQGIHIVLDKSFLPGKAAIMIPHTDDGRVLFAVPWHNRIIAGTTDTPVTSISAEPGALKEEVNFLLEHIARYLTKDPLEQEVKSVFAGLRPLVKSSAKRTAAISRDHSIVKSGSGLISILGGKWTTYRKMAEDVIDFAIKECGLNPAICKTKDILIHGGEGGAVNSIADYYYGSDLAALNKIISDNPEMDALLHEAFHYKKAHVILAIRNEYAVTLDDVLARRTRALLLDARAAVEIAPLVARIMAAELNKDDVWITEQVNHFRELSSNYILN